VRQGAPFGVPLFCWGVLFWLGLTKPGGGWISHATRGVFSQEGIMEAEQVLQRLSDLEARIVSIEAKDGPVELDLDELKAKLAWTVLRCTPRALETVAPGDTFQGSTDIFYGVFQASPFEVARSMSSRAWDDLLDGLEAG